MTKILMLGYRSEIGELFKKEVEFANIPLSVTLVYSDMEAIEILKKEKYDAVLVEVAFPWMHGLISAENIRNEGLDVAIIAQIYDKNFCDEQWLQEVGIDLSIEDFVTVRAAHILSFAQSLKKISQK